MCPLWESAFPGDPGWPGWTPPDSVCHHHDPGICAADRPRAQAIAFEDLPCTDSGEQFPGSTPGRSEAMLGAGAEGSIKEGIGEEKREGEEMGMGREGERERARKKGEE